MAPEREPLIVELDASAPPADELRLTTDAGYPNPHARSALPAAAGPPVALGPPAARMEAGGPRKDDDDDEGSLDDEASTEHGKTLEDFLAEVTPAAHSFPVTVAQSTERQRIIEASPHNGGPPSNPSSGSKGKWTEVKGLQVAVKPANADDCVLLFANCFVTPQIDRHESQWVIRCGGHELSPRFVTYSRQQNWSHSVCLPYLHQPGKAVEQAYQVAVSLGSTGTSCLLSAERQRRQLGAVTFPAHQCLWVEDDESQIVEAGLWQDVPGFAEVITTLPGDKVLVIAAVRYAAQWASEMCRGRFTIARDDVGLDTLADRGLQSVRALAPNLKRAAIMATVDEPPPGPHLYRVRAAVSAAAEQGAVNVVEGERQLAILRLPGHIVAGPGRALGPVEIDEDSWMEIPGLTTTITLKRPRDKVLIVYHADCHPTDYHYEAHFTVFRRCETGPVKNLGFSDEFGLDMVTSDYRCSSEYPVGIFLDVPGGRGPWTYYVAARVANVGTSTENPAVVSGYAGSISAVLLATR